MKGGQEKCRAIEQTVSLLVTETEALAVKLFTKWDASTGQKMLLPFKAHASLTSD